MKACTKCFVSKPLELFSKRKAKSDGRMSECKSCNSERTKQSRQKEPDKFKTRVSNWRARSKGHEAAYRRANRPRETARTQGYRAKKLQAVPKFVTDPELNDFAIGEAYKLAKLRSDITGVKWHVDHVVPLQSDTVCGLHWYANLQVITAKANLMKSNKFWEGM